MPDPAIRKILHVDMDAFFASVEQRDFPEYRGKPLVVGGSPEGRGVVASASYEARAFGVRSAMSAAQAKRLCPKAVFVHPRFEAYQEASKGIHSIFKEATDLIEPLSLDEAYLDVTENKWGEALAGKVAIRIQRRIQSELGLTASAGVSNTLFVAKLASDFKKPRGLTIVRPEEVLAFIGPLSVSKLWGVGPATEKVLHSLGLFKIADLRTFPLDALERELGKHGKFLQKLAFGEDSRTVEPGWERKSYGGETTFQRDLVQISEIERALEILAKDLSESLIVDERKAKTITLKVRYSDFETVTRSQTLHRHVDEVRPILQTSMELLTTKTEAGLRPVRLVGISVTQLLSRHDPEQLWLDLPDQYFK
jgi:DNA polymerase-4